MSMGSKGNKNSSDKLLARRTFTNFSGYIPQNPKKDTLLSRNEMFKNPYGQEDRKKGNRPKTAPDRLESPLVKQVSLKKEKKEIKKKTIK